MFNNKVSRKELFTSNPGQILQQVYRKDFNDSAFQSSEQSENSSQIDNSQGSYDVYSQKFSQSCSQPSENSSSQRYYKKYMSKGPLFQRDAPYNNERPKSSKRATDYLEHLEVNKQKAKEKDNRDLLNTFVSLVKDCSDDVKSAVQIIKDSVNRNLSDSADQSAMLIDKINEGLTLHYQRLLEAIQTDHKQRLTTSELREIIATRDAKIELLEFQLETAQKARDEKVMLFLKEAYNEQKQTTKNQLDQLQKNQQLSNEEHLKTLQQQQEQFNKEKNVDVDKQCKHCDGKDVPSDPTVPSSIPQVPSERGQPVARGVYPYSLQQGIQQPQPLCTALPPALYHTNPVAQSCWPTQPPLAPNMHGSMNHPLTNQQLYSSLYQREHTSSVPLSSSTPSISPIVSASFARWSKESIIKKPSPIATIVPLIKSSSQDGHRQEGSREDVHRQDSGREDVRRQDSGREDVRRQDSGREDVRRQDSGREDVCRQDSCRKDVCRQDSDREDVRRQDSGREDVCRQDSCRKDVCRQDSCRKDVRRQDSGREDVCRQDSGRKDVHRQDSGWEDVRRQDSGRKDVRRQGTSRYDTDTNADLTKNQQRRLDLPVRQSQRLRPVKESHNARSSNMGYYAKDKHSQKVEILQFRRKKRKSPVAEKSHPENVDMVVSQQRARNQNKKNTSADRSNVRKNFKSNKAKPKRKSFRGLSKSLSYSDLSTATHAANTTGTLKRHHSLTTNPDTTSSEDEDGIFLSFLDENSPEICTSTQGEKLMSGNIILKYPDTDDSQLESSQGSIDVSKLQLERNAESEKFERMEQDCSVDENDDYDDNDDDDGDNDNEDDIFSVGEKNTQEISHSRRDIKISRRHQCPSSRRQLLNMSDTNILEISKYIRQQKSRRQDGR
ncbi:uncharacterized protein [Antedon mediterranea]|uniref:uncharacterized protein n=1 Tax=Antedon mediterranea TaxID=105859 RepID=UPI003AF5F02C